jgi:hypothetical protein
LADQLNLTTLASTTIQDITPTTENNWKLPKEVEMTWQLYELFKDKTLKNPRELSKLIENAVSFSKLIENAASFLSDLIQMMFMYKVEMKVRTVDEESITQPIVSAFIKWLCEQFQDIISEQRINTINGILMNAWFPTIDGEHVKIAGKGDAEIVGKCASDKTRKLLVEYKAAFLELKRHHIAQSMLQAYSRLNKQIWGSEEGKKKSSVPQSSVGVASASDNAGSNKLPAAKTTSTLTSNIQATSVDTTATGTRQQQTIAEYFGYPEKNEQGSQICILTNLTSLVVLYVSCKNGQYDFKYASWKELPPEDFVVRLLYLLVMHPDDIVDGNEVENDQSEQSSTTVRDSDATGEQSLHGQSSYRGQTQPATSAAPDAIQQNNFPTVGKLNVPNNMNNHSTGVRFAVVNGWGPELVCDDFYDSDEEIEEEYEEEEEDEEEEEKEEDWGSDESFVKQNYEVEEKEKEKEDYMNNSSRVGHNNCSSDETHLGLFSVQ